METVDEEFLEAASGFIRDKAAAEQPFFVWFNATHMHFRTHVKPESRGQAGRWQSEYHDTMIDHDKLVGDLLGLVDELGIAEDTIVIYSTDNGPHMNSWPDAGMTPFRGEKNSNWEGAYRVPAVVRWPGPDRAPAPCSTGSSATTTGSRPSSPPPACPTSPTSCEPGADLSGTTYKVHLDGHDQLPYLTGETDESPRKHFFYVSDDGDLTAVRFDNWKLVFLEQRATGTLRVWAEPFTQLRVPKIFNLRTDPYERADITSNTYYDWILDHAWIVRADAGVRRSRCCRPSREFPPRQKPASFSLDQVLAKLQTGIRARDGVGHRLAAGAAAGGRSGLGSRRRASGWAPTTTTPRKRPRAHGRGRRALDVHGPP